MNRALLMSTAVLATLKSVSAHASIMQPKPILFDQERGNYNAPLAPDFSNFPCKGFHTQQFNSAETWVAGQEASFTIDMSHVAAHSGGSCQASISNDGGKSFQVIHSFIGDCPRAANGNEAGQDQVFRFKVPEDQPAGEALFSWTWFPLTANREMYQNCAFITIENNNPSPQAISRPEMFVGFLAPGACSVDQQTNLDFPETIASETTDGSQNPTTQFKGKTKPFGSSCGNAESGGGEKILNRLPPNEQLAAAGSNRPAPNPNPGQNEGDNNVAPPTPSSPPSFNDGNAPVIVIVTETVTNAITDMVFVTSTVFQQVPTGVPAKVKREECSFKTEINVGGVCPVPSDKGSTWEACVWTEFCACLDEKLEPSDIVNFGEVLRHCNCIRSGRDCPATTRHRRRQLGAPSLILARSDARTARAFKA